MALATRGGVIQQMGAPAERHKRPANMFLSDFMGSPSMNLILVRATPRATVTEIEISRPDNTPLKLTDCRKLSAPQDIMLGLRSEYITIPSTADNNDNQIAHGLIDVVELAGADSYVVTQVVNKCRTVTSRYRSVC